MLKIEMFTWMNTFFIIAIFAAIFGFAGIVGSAVTIGMMQDTAVHSYRAVYYLFNRLGIRRIPKWH